MIQFFAPEIETTHSLPPEESSHCVRVLRRQPGDIVQAVDGKGNIFTCTIVAASPKRVDLAIDTVVQQHPTWKGKLVVAVAPTKNMDRMEWLVEKLTEVGFDRFVPLECQHSERRSIKPERLERIAVSAMKQSLKATLPEICEMTPFSRVVSDYSGYNRYIAYCDRTIPRILFANVYRPNADTLIIIGPEGDFSPEEIKSALDVGFVPVSLGPSRLRTETAALYAGIVAQAANSVDALSVK